VKKSLRKNEDFPNLVSKNETKKNKGISERNRREELASLPESKPEEGTPLGERTE